MPKYKPTRIIDGLTYYKCNKCNEWFQKDGFYEDKRRLIGICSSCKQCHNKTSVLTRDKDHSREQNKIYMKKKREENKRKFVVDNLDGETWKPIPFEDGYFVSNKGRVKSHKWDKEVLVKCSKNEKGYMQVCLNRKTYRVHRLVAIMFIPNPNEYLEVNHKDENKQNNHIENLEWCDRKYNMNYGTWKERRKAKIGF